MKNINKPIPDEVYKALREYAYQNNISMKQALIDAIQLLTRK